MASERRQERIRDVMARRQLDLTLVLENIHDPHNVSAILRTCDAVGVDRVALLYHVEPFPKIGRKSSASASKWVARERFTSVPECYAALRARGMAIYSTHLDGASRSLYDVDLTQPTALVFGNEHRGVSPEAVAQADGNIVIPQFGMLQSLNVSVSCAVALYEAFRQRVRAGKYDTPQLSVDEIEARVARVVKGAARAGK